MLRMIAVLFAFAVGVTVGLRDAVFASCFFIWNDVFRPSEWARYYGVLDERYFYPVHICTAVLALSLILRPWKRRWNIASTVILISLCWFFLSAALAQFRDIGIERAINAAKYMIPLALISATLCTRRAQLWFLYTLAASVGIWLAHHGLLGLTRQQPLTLMAIPGGQMSDRNDFLVAGTACLPMLFFVAFRYDWRFKTWVRLGAKTALVLSISAFVFSLSRGAIVGLAGLLIWYGLLTGRLVRRFAIAAAVAAVLVAVMPDFVWDRMSTIELGSQQAESSARNRLEHMVTAVNVTLDYPLTGVGPNNFPPVSLRYSVFNAEPHSIWLKCSAEYGLPMLVFFVLMVGLLLVRLRNRAKLAAALGDRQGEAMATALSCALVGFLSTGTFTSQFLSEYMWAIIGLIGAFLATPLIPAEAPPTDDDRDTEIAAAMAGTSGQAA